MDLKEAARAKRNTLNVLGTAGVIGLHMVSGPLVGFAIGYGLDYWLGTHPWLKLAFLLLGIAAGFRNVYLDSQRLLKKMREEDERRKSS